MSVSLCLLTSYHADQLVSEQKDEGKIECVSRREWLVEEWREHYCEADKRTARERERERGMKLITAELEQFVKVSLERAREGQIDGLIAS